MLSPKSILCNAAWMTIRCSRFLFLTWAVLSFWEKGPCSFFIVCLAVCLEACCNNQQWPSPLAIALLGAVGPLGGPIGVQTIQDGNFAVGPCLGWDAIMSRAAT
jgi:hypothetical protein